jgi:hypothetical protein
MKEDIVKIKLSVLRREKTYRSKKAVIYLLLLNNAPYNK